MYNDLRPYLAELIGTFALVFLGAGAVCTASFAPNATHASLDQVSIALAAGFILAAALTATVPISGGYLNPAVTIMLWVFKRFDNTKAGCLLVAQVLGALLAGVCLRLIPQTMNVTNLGTPHLNTEVFGGTLGIGALMAGTGVELVFTFILTFAIFGTMIDPRAPRLGGLAVGLTLSAVVFMGFRLTGGAANPATWLGPAVWEATVPGHGTAAFADALVYLAGPILGALLAGYVYLSFILPTDKHA
jgi:MIP family channel proteins